jgi:hypothetical protein
MPCEPSARRGNSEEEFNQAVTADTKRILGASAPERSDELDQIWNKYQPECNGPRSLPPPIAVRLTLFSGLAEGIENAKSR